MPDVETYKKNGMTDDEAKAKAINGRQKMLEEKKDLWKPIYQDVANFVLPIREDIEGTDMVGKKQGTKAFDGTAIVSLNIWKFGLMGNVFSQAMEWFDMVLPQRIKFLEREPVVREWMQDTKQGMYTALNASNFYDEMSPCVGDGGGIGTANLIMQDAYGKIAFQTEHPNESFIENDRFRKVDLHHRKYKFSARTAAREFNYRKPEGEDHDPRFSKKLADAIKNDPFKEFDFLHAIYPRDEFDATKIDSKNKRYASVYMEHKGNAILREKGFKHFPVKSWRYEHDSNSAYGRSPAMLALSEIVKLNIISKSLLASAQLAADPAMQGPASLEGMMRLRPGGFNYLDDPKNIIRPVYTGAEFPIALDREQQAREVIEKHFFVKSFLMLEQSQGVKTAYEVMELMGEKALVLGPALVNLMVFLRDILDYVFYLEYDEKRLPEVPDILVEYGGGDIGYIFKGPLAQAQERLFRTRGIRSSLESLIPVFELAPETKDNFNWGWIAQELALADGMPQKGINPDEVIKSIRDSRQQQIEEEQQKEDLQRGAETLAETTKADKMTDGKLLQLQGNAA